jgi:hypothetical protein
MAGNVKYPVMPMAKNLYAIYDYTLWVNKNKYEEGKEITLELVGGAAVADSEINWNNAYYWVSKELQGWVMTRSKLSDKLLEDVTCISPF